MKPDQLSSEARARIIWGEPAASVCDFLTANGVSAADAEASIKNFNLERSREIRKIGFRNILTGAPVVGLSVITLYFTVWPFGHGSMVFGKVLGIVVLALLYGLWKLAIGTLYLIYPQFVKKSVGDIGEYDLLE